MINSVKAFAVVIILALTTSYLFAQTSKVVVIPLGGYDGPVCCKVNADGSLIAEESHSLCDADNTQTQELASGQYEVGFLSPLIDVRPRVKMVTIDTRDGTNPANKMAGVADRSFDKSAVYVTVTTSSGVFESTSFNLCLF